MGCISSKQARSRKKSPVFDSPVDVLVSKDDDGGNGRPAILYSSLKSHSNVGFGTLVKIREESAKE